jgi:hypothetical protein
MMELPIKQPHQLNDDAINLVKLAETLQESLEYSCNCSGITDTFRLSCAYETLAELATLLAYRISEYDGVVIPACQPNPPATDGSTVGGFSKSDAR